MPLLSTKKYLSSLWQEIAFRSTKGSKAFAMSVASTRLGFALAVSRNREATGGGACC
jgi:hypothetical protein